MASWFHYGLAEPSEDWYMSNLSPVDNPPPYFLEDRIESVFVPDMLDIGQPDLIILNSIYWDLRYVVYKASHEGWAWQLKRVTRPMTWRELEWHRRRLRTMVELFRERFSGVPLMFRLGEQLALLFQHSYERDAELRTCRPPASEQRPQRQCRDLPDERERESDDGSSGCPYLSLCVLVRPALLLNPSPLKRDHGR